MRRTKFFICLCVCPQRAREVARCWVVTDHRAIVGPASRDFITTRESKKIPFLLKEEGFSARQPAKPPGTPSRAIADAHQRIARKRPRRAGASQRRRYSLPQIAGGPATYERQERKRGSAKPPHGKGEREVNLTLQETVRFLRKGFFCVHLL